MIVKSNCLRFARPPRPGQRPESENHHFSLVFLGIFGQKLDFWSPETQAVIPTKRELMKPLPDRFRDENVQKTYQKLNVFWQKPYIFQKTKPRDPFQMKDLEISHLLVLWIPLYDQIWPIWWRKRVKKQSKWRFPTVPDSSQGFTEASRPFPILPEGLRWCPKVPSLLPRRCMLRKNWSPSVEKKVITECREKSACQERSAEVVVVVVVVVVVFFSTRCDHCFLEMHAA